MDMILPGYYMDISINRIHNNKLEPDYMRIDLPYGFHSMDMDRLFLKLVYVVFLDELSMVLV